MDGVAHGCSGEYKNIYISVGIWNYIIYTNINDPLIIQCQVGLGLSLVLLVLEKEQKSGHLNNCVRDRFQFP